MSSTEFLDKDTVYISTRNNDVYVFFQKRLIQINCFIMEGVYVVYKPLYEDTFWASGIVVDGKEFDASGVAALSTLGTSGESCFKIAETADFFTCARSCVFEEDVFCQELINKYLLKQYKQRMGFEEKARNIASKVFKLEFPLSDLEKKLLPIYDYLLKDNHAYIHIEENTIDKFVKQHKFTLQFIDQD